MVDIHHSGPTAWCGHHYTYSHNRITWELAAVSKEGTAVMPFRIGFMLRLEQMSIGAVCWWHGCAHVRDHGHTTGQFAFLTVSFDKVSDVGICELARMCPLEEIVISGVSKLTDRSVLALANCCTSTLKELYASGCSMITEAALNYLKVLFLRLNMFWNKL